MTARRPLGAAGVDPGCRTGGARATGAAVVSGAVLLALVLTSLPARASVERPPSGRAAAQAEREALSLLHAAARAGHDLAYRGTQLVASWQPERTASGLVDVVHTPGQGATVAGGEDVAATAALDARRLGLLAENFDLAVLGDGTCSGRPSHVVEASRPDGAVAGRFWLDRETGLLLRQQVFGPGGDPLRTSAFVDVSVSATAAAPSAAQQVRRPDRRSLEELRDQGWSVPAALPGGFRLLETSLSTHGQEQEVLHLAYSDGLSSLSLFGQQGRLGTAGMAGFEAETVASRPVWVHHDAHERVVWSGGGRVWTLVSDASSSSVREAVATLPRDEAPRTGLLSRLARGTARLAGLLNPFD